jgi:hypothetical protein
VCGAKLRSQRCRVDIDGDLLGFTQIAADDDSVVARRRFGRSRIRHGHPDTPCRDRVRTGRPILI